MSRVEFIKTVITEAISVSPSKRHTDRCLEALEKLRIMNEELITLRKESMKRIWSCPIDQVIKELEDEQAVPEHIYEDGQVTGKFKKLDRIQVCAGV